MIKIVNDLLVLAEVETGRELKPENLLLKPLILEEVERARLQAGSREITVGHLDDVEAWGDRHRLSLVLSNLLDNAVKYTPEKGTITISAFSDPEWVRLEVSDTGIGIAAADLPHIFDRFYRVDKARSRASGGSGLGLAIAREIVEGYGGRITVASEPGKGSLFTVWLKKKNFSNQTL
jgi:signal transduction histidine kinase